MKGADRKMGFVSADKANGKEGKVFAVSVAILEVIDAEGLLGVTHSKVARRSGVSRAWIYEYLGKDKGALIEFAANVFGEYITKAEQNGLPQTRAELVRHLEEDTEFLFDAIAGKPALIGLYFRFRGTANPVGRVIAKYEENWLAHATAMFESGLKLARSEAQMLAEVLLTLRLGLTHRLATAVEPARARARAAEIFARLHERLPPLSI